MPGKHIRVADEVFVKLYKQEGTSTKVAETIGCTAESVRNRLRRAGVHCTGNDQIRPLPTGLVECACGCGTLIPNINKQARPARYVSGHNLQRIHKERLATRIKTKCTRCGVEVERRPCERNVNNRYFCSRSCKSLYDWEYSAKRIIDAQNKGKAKRVYQKGQWKVCPVCGIRFYATYSRRSKVCCSRSCRDIYCVGDRAPGWRGGLSTLRGRLLMSKPYREWRTAVFVRDGYQCQECGRRTNSLNAHHLGEPFSYLLRKFKIKTLTQARKCKTLWDVSRGQTLCKKCHRRTETYGKAAQYYKEAVA